MVMVTMQVVSRTFAYCLLVYSGPGPQWWVVPNSGFYLKPKNNFTELLHDPDVVEPWYGREGMGKKG